jgi:NCAIR mutase (PurE)-related protein
MTAGIMDWDREARVGLAEAVYGAGKTPAQIDALVQQALVGGHGLLITRLTPSKHADLLPETQKLVDYDATSQTAVLPRPEGEATPRLAGTVGIITGGLADLPAATEAQRTLAFSGAEAEIIADVGVAGLWRLMDRLEDIRRYDVLIAVAGMEAALFSVLAGLVRAPIVALPVSCGKGVAEGGRLALDAALGSCAPGLVAVNIDNGFGAAQSALRILNLLNR